MPTPAELARLAATSPGAFVPKNAEEADAEFERLVRSGIPEQEAEELIVSRVKGSRPDPAAPGFVSQLASNVGDLASGAWESAKTLSAPGMLAQAVRDPQQAAANIAAVPRGMWARAAEGWERAGQADGLEAAGRYAAIPFDALGLPVSRAADHFIAGNTGAGLADTLTAVGSISPRATGAGLKAGAKAVRSPVATAKGLVTEARKAMTPAPPALPPRPGYLAELDRTMRAPEQARALRMDATRTAQQTFAPIRETTALAERLLKQRQVRDTSLRRNASEIARVGEARPLVAADTQLAQNLLNDPLARPGRSARGTALADQELKAAALERNAAELQRVGTARVPRAADTALADNLRRGQLEELHRRLQTQNPWQVKQMMDAREQRLLGELTARLAKAMDEITAAERLGRPEAAAHARAQAEQARQLLASAEGGLFLR